MCWTRSCVVTLCVVMVTVAMVRGAMDPETAEAIERLEKLVGQMSRQMMMQQFDVEERMRSDSNSGIKRMRIASRGTRPYFSTSHVGTNIAAIHDHSNEILTVGMGEIVAVLNGVEFRTRHNDYRLAMKSTTTNEYGAMEDIPSPEVPPAVSDLPTVEEQAAEMREWFKAWGDQDYSVRDYRPYFKPVLCYLEGMWTHSDPDTIDESFPSDRHFLDASSWYELQEKIRYTSYSGQKDALENLAYLPTAVMEVINDTIPVLVQWNYRIACHPLGRDLPTNRLKVKEDVKTRVAHGLSFEQFANSRAARFQVAVVDKDTWVDKGVGYGLLDELMGEVPGNDNYPGSLTDTTFGQTIYPFPATETEELNVAYYFRAYRHQENGAMGVKTRYKSFADENMFVAHTSQPKVAGLEVEHCENDVCEKYFGRWSYAIPLEIIYMTPLSAWNPYNLVYKGERGSAEGKTIYEGPDGTTRDGSDHPDKAFNGTNSKVFYQTPLEFFAGEHGVDPADTTQGSTHVLDNQGNVHEVRASGVRIFLPDIPGVGILRQRYPIMPVSGEGSGVWKNLEALQDMFMTPTKFVHMFPEEMPVTTYVEAAPVTTTTTASPDVTTTAPFNQTIADKVGIPNEGMLHFMLGASSIETGSHTHTFELSEDEADLYRAMESVELTTELSGTHSHFLRVGIVERDGKYFQLAQKCDGVNNCADGHPRNLVYVNL